MFEQYNWFSSKRELDGEQTNVVDGKKFMFVEAKSKEAFDSICSPLS